MSLSKIFISTILIAVLIIFIWFCVLPYRILIAGPFSWKEMYINKNGFVSPGEAGYFADYGVREYSENGTMCKEYFALKDGLTLKKECKTK